MDTISSRENTSFLPIAGLIVGVLALGAVLFAFTKVSKANAEIATLNDKISGLESLVQSASSTADQAKSQASNASSQASTALNFARELEKQVNNAFVAVTGELEKIKTAAPKPGAPKGEKAPVVAGEGEYIIKKGDYGSKIAKAHGVSLADLQAVNPGVDLAKVQIGQKIKLPKK